MNKSNAEMVRAHRRRLRGQGLRPVQFWLPDVRSPEFVTQVARDLAAAAAYQETPAEQALSGAWERAGWEDWPEWTGPDLTKPPAA